MEEKDFYDYQYTDWDLDTIDLHFVSVNDLQKLLERDAPVPLEIYRETARLDAQLQQQLHQSLETLLTPDLSDTTTLNVEQSLPTESALSATTNLLTSDQSVHWPDALQTGFSKFTNPSEKSLIAETSSIFADPSTFSGPSTLFESSTFSEPTTFSDPATFSDRSTFSHPSTLSDPTILYDPLTLPEQTIFSTTSSRGSTVFAEKKLVSEDASEPTFGWFEGDTVLGRIRNPESERGHGFGYIFLSELSPHWVWIIPSILIFFLLLILTIIFVTRRSSRRRQEDEEKRQQSHNYTRYSPGFDDTSRFVVNLKQDQRQDTIIQLRGDPELSRYLTHQVISPNLSPEQKSPTVLSTFSPSIPRSLKVDIIKDESKDKDSQNSSDLEDSNSGQLCQTYTEERGVEVSNTPEDDITETSGVFDRDEETMGVLEKDEESNGVLERDEETSGVIDRDEGIESEEEIDPNAFKTLILNSVKENFAHSAPNHTNSKPNQIMCNSNQTKEKEELYAKINYEAKYRSRGTPWGGAGSPNHSLGSDGNSPSITPPSQTQPPEIPNHENQFFVTSFSGSESECLI